MTVARLKTSENLSDSFYKRLRGIDPYLKAVYDPSQDAIVLWSERPYSPKVYEGTFERTKAGSGLIIDLSIQDLEDWVIKMLPGMDIWNRYGSGKAFDDALADQENSHRDKMRESIKREREAIHKEDRLLWKAAIDNAAHGRFTKETIVPYEIPSETVGIDLKAETKPKGPQERED